MHMRAQQLRTWDELREGLAHLVFKSGAKRVAADLPADPKTVYRILNGKVRRPSLAIKAAVDRLVTESESDE